MTTSPSPGQSEAEREAKLAFYDALAVFTNDGGNSFAIFSAVLASHGYGVAALSASAAQGMVCVPVAKPACAEDDHDWSAIHATHRCDKCGEER